MARILRSPPKGTGLWNEGKYPPATSVFNKWAETGKDEGMANGHTNSVNFMFNKIEPYFNNKFSALDVGC